MLVRLVVASLLAFVGSTARADDGPKDCPDGCPKKDELFANKVGGHVALGVQLWDAGTEVQDVIGRDFGVLGVVAGVNVAFAKRWSADFEFIVNANFKDAQEGVSAMTFVLDPGIVYDWGPLWTGLRLAMRVPSPLGAEFGLIPIIGAKFPNKGDASWYIELDLPVFFAAPGAVQSVGYVQTGLAF